MEGDSKLEFLLLSGDDETLTRDLEQYRKTRGADARYLEYKGELLQLSDPRSGISCLLEAVELADREGRLYQGAMIRKRLGNAFFRLQEFPRSEQYYLEALERFADLGNRHQHDAVSYNMAMVALNLCKLDVARGRVGGRPGAEPHPGQQTAPGL